MLDGSLNPRAPNQHTKSTGKVLLIFISISLNKGQHIFSDYNYPVIKQQPFDVRHSFSTGNVEAEAQAPLLGLSKEYSHFRYKVNILSSQVSYYFFLPLSFSGDHLYVFIEQITEMQENILNHPNNGMI